MLKYFCCQKLLLIFIFSMSYSTGNSQSLQIKSGFGSNGKVITNLANDAFAYNYATALQPDGKILLGGTGLIRTFANGELDNSFGTNGFAHIGGLNSYVHAVTIQADGKIMAAVDYSGLNATGIECFRFNTNGTLDSTYNGTGRVLVSMDNMNVFCRRLAIQPDGKLVIAGFTDSSGLNNIFVARLLTNGAADNTFNSNGKVIIRLTAGGNYANSVAFQSDGKLVLTGTAKNTFVSSSKLFALRLFTNGARDMSFNNTGIYEYTSPSASGGESGDIVSVLSDNKILIAGSTNGNLLITKLQANGVIDNSFNGNGMVITQLGQFNIPSEMHQLAAGKILVTGVTAFNSNPNFYDFSAFQFLSNGTLDLSFNATGKTHIPMLENEHCGGSVVLADGKIVLSGYRDSLSLIHLARFNPNGSIDNTFGNKGVKYLLAKGTDDEIKRILVQTDGKIIALGEKNNGQLNRNKIAIIRYKAEGALDSSFGTNGIFFHPNDTLNPNSIAQQTDGKLIVSVSKTPSFSNYFHSIGAFRLNNNGTIDNSFASATGNLFLADSVVGYATGTNIALQPDGKIILAGDRQEDGNEELVIVRLNNNGTKDNTFGVNGIRITPADSTENYFSSIALQSDGKILIVGSKVFQDSLFKFFVRRLLNNGNRDNSFGINGMSTNIFPAMYDAEPCSIYQRPDGKIVLASTVYFSENDAGGVGIARLTATGNFDNTFNGSGMGFYKYPDSTIYNISVNAMAVGSDSSFYVTGTTYNFDNTSNTFIMRVKHNGVQDSSLSYDGKGWYFPKQTSKYNNSSNDVKIHGDGSIITGGNNFHINEHTDFEMNAFIKNTSGRLYTFTGIGNWNNPGNWSYGIIPPDILPPGNVILINPASGGTCLLNVNQQISAGSSITVGEGATLIVQGSLFIF